jgi:hypothetical protein
VCSPPWGAQPRLMPTKCRTLIPRPSFTRSARTPGKRRQYPAGWAKAGSARQRPPRRKLRPSVSPSWGPSVPSGVWPTRKTCASRSAR